MGNGMKRFLILAALYGLIYSNTALAELGLNLPEPATPIATEIKDVHNMTMQISTFLLVVVFSIVFYSLYTHRKSKGYVADQEFHKGAFGRWSWIAVPALVLGVDLTIAGSAERLLEKVWVTPKEDMMEIKVIGHQWFWEFVYLTEDGIRVESRLLKETPDSQMGVLPVAPPDLYLRAVDNNLVLPTGRNIKFLHTSDDVLHAMWVPQLGFKKDAIPGYIQETWIDGITKPGLYRGQCAEMCGTGHAFMPIVVEAVDPAAFDKWVAEKKEARDKAIAEANSNKVWTMEELMAKGKENYEVVCAACHQKEGSGMPPAFPALADSAIVKGDVKQHINIVLNGKNNMPEWASKLDDLQLASIITYERNAWGNNTGDVVQPKDIKASR